MRDLAGPLQNDDRDLTRGPLLVFAECGALAPGLHPACREKKKQAPGERTFGDLAVVRAEAFDNAFVEARPVSRTTLIAHV